MITLLSKLFIKNRGDTENPATRRAYGTLCGAVGIFLNLLLFAAKFAAGLLSGSIAVSADAFNNLSDALSSFITLFGFILADKKPDTHHPFGHGRIEYVSGLAVAMLIILMGAELAKTSVSKIIHPEPTELSVMALIILLASIAVKVYMFSYNRSIGKKLGSQAMLAAGTDSLSDCVSTAVVLVSMLVAHFFSLNIDAWAGLAVAVFILIAGIKTASDTLSPLLGEMPDTEFVNKVYSIVLSHKEFVGVHDLIVHDYGPGRRMISLHGEMPGNVNLFFLHDCIDRVEQELSEKLNCTAVIHLDPIETDNELVNEMRAAVSELVSTIGPSVSIHDFRMVTGQTHTNLIFDVVVPFGFFLSDDETKAEVERLISENFENHFAVVQIDKPYTM